MRAVEGLQLVAEAVFFRAAHSKDEGISQTESSKSAGRLGGILVGCSQARIVDAHLGAGVRDSAMRLPQSGDVGIGNCIQKLVPWAIFS